MDLKALSRFVDDGFNEIVGAYGRTLEQIFLPILKMLLALERGLIWLPWWVVLLALAGLAWAASREIKTVAIVAVLTIGLGVLGVWEAAMATIALMLVSTFLAILIGIPLGVAISRSNPMQSVVLPVLDIMQTMPIFIYLIPFVMLFGPGKIPALLATIIFAIPARDPVDQPWHSPSRCRDCRSGALVWGFAAPDLVFGANSAGAAHHHGRDQPNHDDGAVDGGDCLDDRCRRVGLSGFARHSTA